MILFVIQAVIAGLYLSYKFSSSHMKKFIIRILWSPFTLTKHLYTSIRDGIRNFFEKRRQNNVEYVMKHHVRDLVPSEGEEDS